MTGLFESRRRTAGVFLLAGWLLILLLQSLVPRTADRAQSVDYDVIVESLHEGRPFVSEPGNPLLTHPPVFPLVLATLYSVADAAGIPRDLAYRWFTALLLSACGSVVFLIASRWTRFLPSAVCGAAVSLHPFSFVATTTPLSAVPFTLLLLLVVHQLASCYREEPNVPRAALIGLLTGLALLTRAIAILLPAIVAGWLLIYTAATRSGSSSWWSRLAMPVVFALTVAATVSPWPLWTAQELGRPTLLSDRGGRALRDGISLNIKDFREPIALSPRVQALQRRTDAVYSDLDTPSRYLAYLASEMRRDPVALGELFLLKVRRAWYGLDSQDAGRERIGRLVAVGFGLPTLLALGLLLRRHRRDALSLQSRLLIGTVLSIVFLFWGMTTISASLARYMIPAYSLLPVIWSLALATRPTWARPEPPQTAGDRLTESPA